MVVLLWPPSYRVGDEKTEESFAPRRRGRRERRRVGLLLFLSLCTLCVSARNVFLILTRTGRVPINKRIAVKRSEGGSVMPHKRPRTKAAKKRRLRLKEEARAKKRHSISVWTTVKKK